MWRRVVVLIWRNVLFTSSQPLSSWKMQTADSWETWPPGSAILQAFLVYVWCPSTNRKPHRRYVDPRGDVIVLALYLSAVAFYCKQSTWQRLYLSVTNCFDDPDKRFRSPWSMLCGYGVSSASRLVLCRLGLSNGTWLRVAEGSNLPDLNYIARNVTAECLRVQFCDQYVPLLILWLEADYWYIGEGEWWWCSDTSMWILRRCSDQALNSYTVGAAFEYHHMVCHPRCVFMNYNWQTCI